MSRRRLVATGTGVTLAVVAGAVAFGLRGGEEQTAASSGADFLDRDQVRLAAAAARAGCKLTTAAEEGNDHVKGRVTYGANPPHSGDHSATWAEDDLYRKPAPREQVVHTLEHGRVVYWVPTDASKALRATVRALYTEDPYHVLATPDPRVEKRFVVTAWRHTLTCERANRGALDAARAFKEIWRDKGPEYVP